MPAYFFHLAFELQQRCSDHQTTYSPPSNLNVFDSSLPSHKASSWASFLAPRSPRRRPSSANSENTTTKTHLPPPSLPVSKGELVTPAFSEPTVPLPQDQPADWRFDIIQLESIDIERSEVQTGKSEGDTSSSSTSMEPVGSQLGGSGAYLRGCYVPSNPKTTDIGYGVVHLYRDSEPSPDLEDFKTTQHLGAHGDHESAIDEERAFVDNTCTTLCVLAVPSYMTPSDLLGWLGEATADRVSHLRLVRSSRANKYMVLMKFREAAQAKAWQREWNGRPFNSMEPENCHAVFVRSIEFQVRDVDDDPSSFPDRTNDPFIPALKKQAISAGAKKLPTQSEAAAHRSSKSLSAKPAPPPTPALVELPTCPVCLERMDETTGLATIFCQHVFHCACLQKWRNSGCPVCRYTQNEPTAKAKSKDRDESKECASCGSRENVWICLICGKVGCGRYDEAHAFAHYEQTGHSFAMDIATQHIWDYAGDEYVHRLIQNKSDGRLLDLPLTAREATGGDDRDYVPRDKMENMTLEYTYLITSQLDSQRVYFEEQVDRAVDKASQATAAADQANETATEALARLESVQASHQVLQQDTVPTLEREKERAERRAEKFETMARKMEKEWREKEVINESLMDRIAHLEKRLHETTLKATDLEEQNRDLSFFISGMEKLKDAGSEVQQGTLSIGDGANKAGGKKNARKQKQRTGG